MAAAVNPALVSLEGPLVFGDLRVSIPLLASGAILGLGFFILFLEMKRATGQKLWPAILFGGALLFGNGLVVPIRTVGLVLLCAALFRYGRHQYRQVR